MCEAGGGSAEPKTRTPHKDVGKKQNQCRDQVACRHLLHESKHSLSQHLTTSTTYSEQRLQKVFFGKLQRSQLSQVIVSQH